MAGEVIFHSIKHIKLRGNMIVKDTYHLIDRNDYEIHFKGLHGKKGEKRSPRAKPTPEQIKKQNQWNKVKRVDRKINLNFAEGESTYVTLTYNKDERPESIEDFKRDRKNFIEGIRKEYNDHDISFKWISRSEVGSRGAAHLHFLINDIPGVNMVALVRKYWKHGRAHCETAYDLRSGKLAEYFTKLSPKEISGQLTWMSEKDQKAITSYSCSRNLKEPEKETKVFKARTVEKMIREGIEPTPGYYIDEESIRYGINPFNGYSYLHYRELKCRQTLKVPVFAPVSDITHAPPWEELCT